VLGRIHASDSDLAENGTITYWIETTKEGVPELSESYKVDGTEYFSIDQNNGNIFLHAYLDADNERTPKSFEIRVVAQDKGGLQEKCVVLVTLIDVNDHKPAIISPSLQSDFTFAVDVDENSGIERTVVDVRCVDPDFSRSKVMYSLEKDLNNDWTNFRVNEYSDLGALKNTKDFDCEKRNEYRVRMVCVDSGIMINLSDLENEKFGESC
jgi:hypothetical protein